MSIKAECVHSLNNIEECDLFLISQCSLFHHTVPICGELNLNGSSELTAAWLNIYLKPVNHEPQCQYVPQVGPITHRGEVDRST